MIGSAQRVTELSAHVHPPRFYRVRPGVSKAPPIDVLARVRRELDSVNNGRTLAGLHVGIAVGSRGIDQLPAVVRCVTDWIRRHGGSPEILPAMGSHGGGTATGQAAVLEALGVTADSVSAPIEPDTATEPVGKALGRTVYWSAAALRCDLLIVINRVKPHTAFRARRESGITKMLVVGLGKHRGAAQVHAMGLPGLAQTIPAFAEVILEAGPPVIGVALVEDGRHRLCHVEAIPASRLSEREPELLELARSRMATLPIEHLDVLVVDRIGKNISGDGMDPNVTGRYANRRLTSDVHIEKIVVLGLTRETGGNGNGIGFADFSTADVIDVIDWETSYINALTGGVTDTVRIPVCLPSPDAAVRAAMAAAATAGGTTGDRLIRIRSTLHLEELVASEALIPELAAKGCAIQPEPVDLFADLDLYESGEAL